MLELTTNHQYTMNTSQFEQDLKTLFTNWKSSLEEMRVQFALGKMDAVETFERQKNQLRALIETVKINTDKATDMAEEHSNTLRAKLDELILQLSLGKAETKDLYMAQRAKIDHALHEVLTAAKYAYVGNYSYMMELFDHNTKAIQTGLEIAQLQFALAKMEAKEESEKLRKELNEKINELQMNSKNFAETTKETMDKVSKQWHDNLSTFTNWIQSQYKK